MIKHGFVDKIVHRRDQVKMIKNILAIHNGSGRR
jgi:acetyl-CoA carboxylase beta subunit